MTGEKTGEGPRMLDRPLLTVRDVALMLKLKESTIRQMIASGRLRAIKFGREWRVTPTDLELCLNAHATQVPPPATNLAAEI